MPRSKKKNGSALLTALFIMTLVAVVATAMSTKIQLDIYRTKLIVMHDQLYLASQAVTFWAISELNNKNNNYTKANAQGMVSQYPASEKHSISSITLSGALYDLQAQFNINNLSDKKSLMGFMKLIRAVTVKSSPSQQMKLTLAVTDWLSSYDLARGNDNYLSYYLGLKPPYHPSHQLMSSKSELRLIKDVSDSIYLALEPFITALPESSLININTAPLPVLKSLGHVKNEGELNELIMERKEHGIKDLKTISEILKKLDVATDQITLESNYFLSVAQATGDHMSLTVCSLLKRVRDKKGNLSVTLLRESFNVLS